MAAAERNEALNNPSQLFIWPKQIAQRQQQQEVLELSAEVLNGSFTDQALEIKVESVQGDDGIDTDRQPLENINTSQNSNISGQDTLFAVNLIEEVRRYPCLWNISLASHKDKPKKQEAWRRISAVLNIPGIMLIKHSIMFLNENQIIVHVFVFACI
jgi:hypothetical protein